MAERPLTVCAEPGCRVLVRGSRCDAHQAQRLGRRSVLGGTSRWKKASLVYRRYNPYCISCLFYEGRYQPAECVDHIIPHLEREELFWDEGNWQSLCWRCHSYKRGVEQECLAWQPQQHKLVVCGLPATGKTTMAQSLAAKWDCEYWDSDNEADKLGIPRLNQTDAQQATIKWRRAAWLTGRTNAIVIVARPISALRLASALRGSVHHVTCDERERQRRLLRRTA